MADSSRPAKLARLASLRQHVAFTSKSALEDILKNVKEEGLPDLCSRKNMTESNKQFLSQQAGMYGPLLQTVNLVTVTGAQKPVEIINLLAWLAAAYKNGGGFHKLLQAACGSQGSNVLHLLLYADEVTPGNPLAHKTARKVWCLYASIKEFNTQLQNENAWVTLCCVRSSIVSELDGHLSQLVKAILCSIFQSQVCSMDVGLLLTEPAGCFQPKPHKRLSLKMGFMIMDGQAFKFTMSSKGDSGSRFCMLCRNVFLAGDTQDNDEGFVAEVSAYTKHNQLSLTEDAEIYQSWQRLQERSRTCSRADFNMWQQAAGMTWSEHAMLNDLQMQQVVQPCTMMFHDWMHALLSNGILNIAIHNVLEELSLWSSFSGYIAHWKLPAAFKGISIKQLFDSKRVDKHRKSQKINCTASEMLSLVPIMAHYLRNVCPNRLESLPVLLLSKLVDMLQATWQKRIQPEELLDVVEASLEAWKNAGWKMIKKHHWLLHLPDSYRRHQLICNCFVMERKNKTIGRVATAIQNTLTYETSIHQEVVTAELMKVSEKDCFSSELCLLKKRQLQKKCLTLLLGFGMHA